jgi:hypothetical protein
VPLQLGSRTAALAGVVGIDETEPLVAWLRDRGRGRAPVRIHLGACTHLHSAVLQALLAARVQISVPPVDPFLRTWVAPLFEEAPRQGPQRGRGKDVR